MIKKIKYIIMLSVIFTIGLYTSSFARITTNDPSVKSGEKVTITINSQEAVASGAINISSNDGLIFNSVSGGTANGTLVAFSKTENTTSGIATYTFTAPEVSVDTTYKIVFVSQDMADIEGNSISPSTATATVTVKANNIDPTPMPDPDPTPEPEPTPQPDPQPQQPTTPTVTEPNFTSVNRTMYATGDINLRASWSTNSVATPITKGTELTITGTSTERVNGYIWYRVRYNGTTKYVASNLLTNTNPTEEEEKSNNNLKTLVVKGFSISPSFKAETLEYSLQVTDDTEKLDITAEAENEKATVKIEGNETLAEGENIIKIIVTAENGTTKTYTIKAIKQQEKVFGLQSLTIKGTNISNQFHTDLYEYEIKVKDVDTLDIQAIATDEDAIIEILGNENLQEGENIITIIVHSSNEENTVTYQITATKTITVIEEPEQNTIDFKYILYGIIGAVILIALIIVVVYTIKHRKVGMYEEDETDDFEYYPEDLPEREEEYYQEELPQKNNYFEDNYSEEPYEEVDNEEYEEIEEDEEYNDDQEGNNNYFLDDPEDWDDGKSNRRGKHF